MNLLTGIEENINDITISIFPNPASEFLTIKSDKNEKLQIEIYSSLGEKVIETKTKNKEIKNVQCYKCMGTGKTVTHTNSHMSCGLVGDCNKHGCTSSTCDKCGGSGKIDM